MSSVERDPERGRVAAGLKALPTDATPNKVINPHNKKPMQDGLPEAAYYDAIRINQLQNPPPPCNSGQSGACGKGGCQQHGNGNDKGRPGGGACGSAAGPRLPSCSILSLNPEYH